MSEELYLELEDIQWPFVKTTHHRDVARAIVYDASGTLYFTHIERNDLFGQATIIETAGGGVEPGESFEDAIHRELQEELGVTVELVAKLGVVSDYYNLIHRHNLNHYFLCKVTAVGTPQLTKEECENFHLTTWKGNVGEAIAMYEACAVTKLGRLMANRELPVLYHAKALLEQVVE